MPRTGLRRIETSSRSFFRKCECSAPIRSTRVQGIDGGLIRLLCGGLVRTDEGAAAQIPPEKLAAFWEEKMDRYMVHINMLEDSALEEDKEVAAAMYKHRIVLDHLKTDAGATAYSRDLEKIREAVGFMVPVDRPGETNAWLNPMLCPDLVRKTTQKKMDSLGWRWREGTKRWVVSRDRRSTRPRSWGP
jgi:hypothetical protein